MHTYIFIPTSTYLHLHTYTYSLVSVALRTYPSWSASEHYDGNVVLVRAVGGRGGFGGLGQPGAVVDDIVEGNDVDSGWETCCVRLSDLVLEEDDGRDSRGLEQNLPEFGQQFVTRQNVGHFGLKCQKIARLISVNKKCLIK